MAAGRHIGFSVFLNISETVVPRSETDENLGPQG